VRHPYQRQINVLVIGRLSDDMILNIAHRGASSIAPENTFAAIRKAYEVGANLWETDVTMTADEELVLLHDDTLVRTTDAVRRYPDRAPWAVSAFTLAEIRTLDAGSWFVDGDPFGQVAAGAVLPVEQATYRGECVPSLRSMLILTAGIGWRVNLELKPLPPAMNGFPLLGRVLALIDELDIDPGSVIISSFNHDWLRQAQACNPHLEIQALVGDENEGPAVDWDYPEFKTYNVPDTLLDADHVATLREKGINFNVYTIDDEAGMRRGMATGVTGLITDFPQTLANLKRQLGQGGDRDSTADS
jgi:glycerophosphoryl diester phosphodiesterase